MLSRQHTYAVALVFLACPCAPLTAQEVLRAGEPSPADSIPRLNSASILFDRNNNTYNWAGRATIDTMAAGIRIGFIQQYVANIIQFEDAALHPKLQSSEQNISLLLRAPLSETFSPQFQWTSLVYTDNKGTGLNSASTHTLLGGGDYAVLPWLFLTPMGGYRWDTQAGIADHGIAYALGARLPGIDVDGYRIAGNALYREERINPRKLEGHIARIGIQKAFTDLTRDSLDFGFNRNRREFYAMADSNIESRAENVFAFTNRLDYDIDPSLTTTLYVTINERSLDKDLRNWNAVVPRDEQFDTHIDEFRLDTYLQAAYRSSDGRTGGWLRFFYSERTEAHAAKRPPTSSTATELRFSERNKQEQIKDNTSRRTILSGSVDFPLSLSDHVSLSGSAGILRYDTPSELNVEDRDELLVVLTLATSHRISRSLELGIALDGTLGHTVYLLKERSANNSINRVLRLSPRALFRPVPWITSLNAFEVLANYTVYDYEQQLGSVRNYSYRQFGWIDSTAFDLTHRLGIDLFAYWRVYERGQLNWSEFTERTESAASEQTYAVQFRFTPGGRMMFAVGARYFGQSRYTFADGTRKLDTFLSSVGPTSAIVWEPGPHTRLQFQGWYERRRQPDGSERTISNMTMNISLNL